ncbi:hypothetical protein M436DRAFT_85990 [Aureobasidium namibiae CBS 147.97]|uniref:Uncharacterized protein n=1 Tax=Aureobasidium namibiae CBS 147.97 TaxID=1043004 RepID=A0A074W7I6_9PEZI
MSFAADSRVASTAPARWAELLEEADEQAFRSACEKESFHTVASQFFTCLRTTLMDSSLSRLIAISEDPELRKYVKTIRVQDDCSINDPYNTSDPLHSSEIWPRDTSGYVLTQQIGVNTLRDILAEGKLCPENIIIRDHRIASVNFAVCPETTKTVDYRIHLRNSPGREPVAAFAKEIVCDLALPITYIEMRAVDHLPPSKDSMLFLWAKQSNEHRALGSPELWDVCMKLLPSCENSTAIAGPFSLLRSAELNVASYWLEQILLHAVNLKRLQLQGSSPWDIPPHPSQTCSFRLTELKISRAAINAGTILSILVNSSDTLTKLCFEWVRLKEESTWAVLLPTIADRFPNLTVINIQYLRNGEVGTGNSRVVCFDEDEFDGEWRSSMILHEKRRLSLKRVIGVSYEGPHVAAVMRNLALHSKALSRLFEVD